MVIINYWIMLTLPAEVAVTGVVQVAPIQETQGPVPPPDYVSSVTMDRVNTFRPDTIKMLRNFPERYQGRMPPGLWNCYVTADGLHALVAMREELQETMARYPVDFQVAGCWDFYSGQPVGGVGSPWFDTPPGLAAMMPGIQLPSEDPGPPPLAPGPVEYGVLHDIVLGAGQAPRRFI